jgi:NAD(P)-dependent dehydrogenase (short-subunit alcohol dehydrogenase family)
LSFVAQTFEIRSGLIAMHDEIREMFDLSGQVAMVTGGARDLGYDAACILAAAGADLIITSRKLSSAEKTAASLRSQYDCDVLPLAMDQTSFEPVSTTSATAHAWKNRVDILVNNAGGGGAGNTVATLFEREPEHIDGLIQLNLNGTLYCCREIGRKMKEQQSGSIINIASIAGMLGRNRSMYERNQMLGQPVDYAAAKGGVLGMTMDLAAVLGPDGVRVNAISPGGFSRNLPEQFVEDFSERTALGRMGRDGIDLKGAILFLASAASEYVTGVNLPVDGGFAIWH